MKVRQSWKLDFVRKLANKTNINKTYLCEVFNIARSTLYYKKRQIIKDTIFKTKVSIEHVLSPYYGQRRMACYFKVNIKKVTRIMQIYNIYAETRKRKKFVKPGDKNLPHMGVNNLKKEMVINKLNQVWSSDFTHLYYKDIEFYLATVLDEYSKEIVGYKIGMNHEKELIIGALTEGIRKRGFTPDISHSDQGSEYRSYQYFDALERYKISASMSRKASPWENAGQESFYGKFKFELGNLNRFNTIDEAIEAIHLQIYYYNNNRIHTSINMPPVEFANSH